MSGMQQEPYQVFARENLGYEFNNLDLLITAFTHRSYVNEHRKSVSEHNERLEFLGDAVLELVVTDFLFRNYTEPEGILTSWRASLVRTESIGDAGNKLGYEPLVRMSRGEKQGGDRARMQILANAFEALVELGPGSINLNGLVASRVQGEHLASILRMTSSFRDLTPGWEFALEVAKDALSRGGVDYREALAGLIDPNS